MTRPSDPVERKEPDLDPGLAPDPEHDVKESPPENTVPAHEEPPVEPPD